MCRSHFSISCAMAPTYCRPISSSVAGSAFDLRREEARVDGIGIGTADERDLDDVVGGDHPRVAGVELTRQAVAVERRVQRVDAIGDVERGPLVTLGQEVAHRTIERAREPDGHAVGGHERERSVDPADALRVAVEDAPPRLVRAHVADAVEGGIEEIDDPADSLEHAAIVSYPAPWTQGSDGALHSSEGELSPGYWGAASARCCRCARPG